MGEMKTISVFKKCFFAFLLFKEIIKFPKNKNSRVHEYETNIALDERRKRLKNDAVKRNNRNPLVNIFVYFLTNKYANGILNAIEAAVIFLFPVAPLI